MINYAAFLFPPCLRLLVLGADPQRKITSLLFRSSLRYGTTQHQDCGG